MALIDKKVAFLALDYSVNKVGIVVMDSGNRVLAARHIQLQVNDKDKVHYYSLVVTDYSFEQAGSIGRISDLMQMKTTAFDSGKKVNGLKRARAIVDHVIEFVTMVKKQGFDLKICIEDYSYGSFGLLIDIAEVSGLAKLLIFETTGVEPTPIPISSWKTDLTGFGQAKKPEIQLAVNDRLGFIFDEEDVNDACGICMYFIRLEKGLIQVKSKKSKAS